LDELTSAGILLPELRKSYTECKRLNSQHGKTYYLATQLLPREKRPHVHALYGFARYADEIVDDLASTLTHQEKIDLLDSWSLEILRDIARGASNDPIGAALVHTVNTFKIPIDYFKAFIDSMKMDLTKSRYENFDELSEYVYGSAAVIGLQMVHVLGALPGEEERALESASKLGIAFQLANFIRDVGEDLERGRIYLPQDELAEAGVTELMLRDRKVTPEIITALSVQIKRVRALQSEAESGIALLSPPARPCIEAASELYCGIVDEVEAINYEIFTKRAKTSMVRRLGVALPAWLRAISLR
jgi:phytoene synthase